MALATIDYRRHVRRPLGFVLLGLVLAGVSGYLVYTVMQAKPEVVPAASAYNYHVTQSVKNEVTYFPSSFYGTGPGPTNTIYVMDLTNKINTMFRYDFSASSEEALTYTYDVKALVRAKYSILGGDENAANVWTKQFQLVKPVTRTETVDKLTLAPSVDVPYADYKKLLDDLKTALVLPVDSDVLVTFSVRVSGVVGGKPFDDIRTSTMSAPVGTQIYAITTKYDKEDSKQVVPVATQAGIDRATVYEMYGAIALGVIGVASVFYGLRKRIFKTTYQRELDRIYRYHDGIIIRASKQPDLRGKEEIHVQSFDDMLNLEEELKAPIVAMSVGGLATRFMIIRDDMVYMYHLGDAPRESKKSLERIANSVTIKDISPAHESHHTKHRN